MSYLIQRSYAHQHDPQHDQHDVHQDQDVKPQLSHNGRINISSPAYDPNYPPHTASPSPSYSSDHQPTALPKVGQTRCYWALLSNDLQFIYLDPVLAYHLEGQADLLVGKSLLTFVHPDEQGTAKLDLGGVLESRTLHGSITRVRFSRLSKVRRMLGHDGPPAPWSDADKIALDKDYMAVDIVINWAADGLVLCFIHAIVDLNPNDNDEHNKTHWTNWCGTPCMDLDQISLLNRRLSVCVPRADMSRVFQILSSHPDRTLLLSWPPDQGHGLDEEFGKLVARVTIGTGGNDAKTSCTRRYKALQDTPWGQVESIFIPHGSIIFACHKLNPPSRSDANPSASMQQLGYSTGYNVQQNPPFYGQGSSYALPPSQAASYTSTYVSQSGSGIQGSYSPQRWSQTLPAAMSNLRSGSYPPLPPQGTQSWPQVPEPPSSSYIDTGSLPQASFNRSNSPTYSYSPTTSSSAGASPTSDFVPPPRRRVSTESPKDQYSPTGRNVGNRPMGVQKCSSCKATSSPEWRKGPSGKKELCNACGLRFARSRAKKEGNNLTQRRRKDKGIIKRESATPPTSASPSYSSIRRSFGDNSFSASSPGSASGSDIYSHSNRHVLDNMTPSPSLPASTMNFVHYSPSGDNRPPYTSHSNAFYSAPSPLSHPPVSHEQEQQHNTQLPPLGQLSSYGGGRHSPLVTSSSPISHSALTSTLPPASYERERDRDRELPPTPLSAEPRHSRRSILTQQ